MKRLIGLVFLCFVLSSCVDRNARTTSSERSSRKSQKSQKYLSKKIRLHQETPIDLIRQQEAKLTDIPQPLQASPLKAYCLSEEKKSPDTIILGYNSQMSSEEIKNFYIQEMERLGWQQTVWFDGPELLLSFEKPERVCTISIRPDLRNRKHKTGIFIFSGNKQLS